MKKRFSLNDLLHNNKIMIAFSLVAAIVVWALVSFGPGNVQERTIPVTFKVDLTDTSAGYNDLRVIGENTFTVNVVVEGTRAVIYNLGSEDIDIRPSLADIQGPGRSTVSLSAAKAGKTTGYTINSLSPSTVAVTCDYWISSTFPVATDVSLLSVQDQKAQQLGDILLDSDALTDGNIRIEGPQTTIQQIASVVARVETAQTLTKTTHFKARLLALNAAGAEVDLSNCVFTGLSGDTIDMTVPVWVQRQVSLHYTLAHVPAGLSQTGLVTLSQNSVTLVGEEDALEAAAATIGNLGTFDFDHLQPSDAAFTVTLAVPSGVKVLEGDTISVTLAVGNYATKTLSYDVQGIEDVTVQNLPEGRTITLQGQKLTGIVLCGKAATLRRITAADLKLTLDASSNTGMGSVRYTVRIEVPRYPDVWVYYGKDDASAYRLYGTLE